MSLPAVVFPFGCCCRKIGGQELWWCSDGPDQPRSDTVLICVVFASQNANTWRLVTSGIRASRISGVHHQCDSYAVVVVGGGGDGGDVLWECVTANKLAVMLLPFNWHTFGQPKRIHALVLLGH